VIAALSSGREGERLTVMVARLGLPKGAVHRQFLPLGVRGSGEQEQKGGCIRRGFGSPLLWQRLFPATRRSEFCRPMLERQARDARELVRMMWVRGERLVRIGSAQGAPAGLHHAPEIVGAYFRVST